MYIFEVYKNNTYTIFWNCQNHSLVNYLEIYFNNSKLIISKNISNMGSYNQYKKFYITRINDRVIYFNMNASQQLNTIWLWWCTNDIVSRSNC